MRTLMIAVLSAALISPLMVGCGDREVQSSKDESHNPITGNTTTTEKNTYQRPDGSTYQNTNKETTPSH